MKRVLNMNIDEKSNSNEYDVLKSNIEKKTIESNDNENFQ